MASEYFLAFDLGAQSGRAMLGELQESTLKLTEIHRFINQPVNVLGHLHWNILNLFDEMKIGLKKCSNASKQQLSGIGIDTWGVDFGFVGRNDVLLGNPYAYWDNRTDGMMEVAFQMMSKEEIYRHTGIQFMKLNSIFQLLSMVMEKSPILDVAEKLLFMPDLLNFMMTGHQVSEYTIASTSQLYDSQSDGWAKPVFSGLNLPFEIMPKVVRPGTMVGKLRPEIQREIDGNSQVQVIAPACHDTGSAVAAVPAKSDNWAYLSSGTWSLMGIETPSPIITEASLRNNFTNEGGVDNTIRFLRNVMGLWLVQGCRQSWQKGGETLDYDTLLELADKASPFAAIINPDESEFFSTQDMVASINDFVKLTGQKPLSSKGAIIRTVLESLALKYRHVLDMLNQMRGRSIETLHIVGGGVRNKLLNQFTANALGIPVIAGPVEATAIGNVLVQAIAQGLIASVQDARDLVSRSFELERYEPRDQHIWQDAYGRFCDLFQQNV